MKKILLLIAVLLLNGCNTNVDKFEDEFNDEKELITDIDLVEDDTKDTIIEESKDDLEEIISHDSSDEVKLELENDNEVIITEPQATKEPEKTNEPTFDSIITSELTITPEPTVTPTPIPTTEPTPISTAVSTLVPTPDIPKDACPGGYNPSWDCGKRIDKAESFKLFSVVEYGNVDAAFAACDADERATTEFNGVEVRAYACSQQTRNDYGVWGFAIYYMDENGNIIH